MYLVLKRVKSVAIYCTVMVELSQPGECKEGWAGIYCEQCAPGDSTESCRTKNHVKDSLGCLSIPWVYNGYTEDDNGELACWLIIDDYRGMTQKYSKVLPSKPTLHECAFQFLRLLSWGCLRCAVRCWESSESQYVSMHLPLMIWMFCNVFFLFSLKKTV